MIILKNQGSKNSSLPLITSCLLSKNIFKIYNVPNLLDILSLIELLLQFNVVCKFDNNVLEINTLNLKIPNKIIYNRNFRAAYYLPCALYYLIKNDEVVKFRIFSGCRLGSRNIDYHLQLFRKMNILEKFENDNIYIKNNKNLTNFSFCLPKPSVGCTINFILLNVISRITCILYNYAKDPYIDDLIEFLILRGAKIEKDDQKIKIIGSEFLKAQNFKVMDDPIVFGTNIIISSIFNSNNLEVLIEKSNLKNLGNFKDLLTDIGIVLNLKDNFYCVSRKKIKFVKKIQSGYFPEIYTDLIPIILLFLIHNNIKTILVDNIFENRFNFLEQLSSLGYKFNKISNNIIETSTSTKTQIVNDINFKNYDIRGDSCILLAYVINNIEICNFDKIYLNRGFENLYKNMCLIQKCLC